MSANDKMMPIGVPGTAASSSKRGYRYQDLVTALAWTNLRPDETLYVEVAEDLAVGSDGQVVISQVKDVAASITLIGSLQFLDRVVQLIERNPGQRLFFVYRTTGRAGTEKNLEDRPAGIAGLEYWRNVVKDGINVEPLLDVLKAHAQQSSPLGRFLKASTPAEVLTKLIKAVTWASDEPDSRRVEQELFDRIATIAHVEHESPWGEGRKLLPLVVEEVSRISTDAREGSRRLSFAQLRNLIERAITPALTRAEYNLLVRDASIGRNPPTQQVNEDIRTRLDWIRRARFFPEAEPSQRARELATDVRVEGRCAIADSALRAIALSWSARILSDDDKQLARDLISEALALDQSEPIRAVAALLKSDSDLLEAREDFSRLRSKEASTLRYVAERNASNDRGRAWLIAEGEYDTSRFDADGCFLIIHDRVKSGDWQAAISWIDSLSESHFDDCPALHWIVGLSLLASTVPTEIRHLVLTGPPVADELVMSYEPVALEARRRSAKHFERFHGEAARLNLHEVSLVSLEYSLWILLQDAATRPSAKVAVRDRWGATGSDLRWLPLALIAGIDFEKRSVADELDLRGEKYGAWTASEARARLALLLASPAAEWVGNWTLIKTRLAPHVDSEFLDLIEIQSLARTGRIEDARRALDVAEGFSPDVKERIRLEIEETVSEESVTDIVARVGAEPSPVTLRNAVDALLKQKRYLEAQEYCYRLFDATGDREVALDLVKTLAAQDKWAEVLQFLGAHPTLPDQSEKIAAFKLDALWRMGNWVELRSLIQGETKWLDLAIDLDLRLSIYSGDWERLGLLLERALQNPKLGAEEAIKFAQIATAIGRFGAAEKLATVAAKLEPSSPKLLWTCYLLAVRGRWDDRAVVHTWMHAAISLSGPEGPVQAKSFGDLIDLVPKWKSRQEQVSKGVAAGEMYLGLVAQAFNMPLSNLLVAAAESNQLERDPGRRTPLSAFAGIDRPVQDPAPRQIAVDQTALLTFGQLGVLDQLGDSFDKVWVPHSIGMWLFREHQEVQFHQPSRIFEARDLLGNVARGLVSVATPEAKPSAQLIQEIGPDLADLTRCALDARAAGEFAFLIRAAPIHRIGSLMNETANVDDIADLLRSTIEVVRTLKTAGAVTDAKYEQSLTFLSRNDEGWPGDSFIPQGASVFIDDVSVSYFNHLRIWPALFQAGFKVRIHSDMYEEAVQLDRLDQVAHHVSDVIQRIRQFIFEGQKNGRVGFMPLPSRAEDEDGSDKSLLMQTVLGARIAGVLIADDRAINKHDRFSYDDESFIPVGTSLDVLGWMRDAENISEANFRRLKTDLRRFGYLFVQPSSEDFVEAVETSIVRDQQLIESVSARAIRENLMLAQMSGMLQIASESRWLSSIGSALISAISKLWRGEEDTDALAVKSTWLVDCSHWGGFAGDMTGEWDEGRVFELDALAIGRLLFNSVIPKARRADYNGWLEAAYLAGLKRQRPRVFERVAARVKAQLLDIPRYLEEHGESSADDRKAVSADLCKSFVRDLPESLKESVFSDDVLLKTLGLSRFTRVSIESIEGVGFDLVKLYGAAADALAGKEASVLDSSAAEWIVSDGDDVVCRNSATGEQFVVRDAQLVSPSASTRSERLAKMVSERKLEPDDVAPWHRLIQERPLSAHEIHELEKDLAESPESFARWLTSALRQQSLEPIEVVPTSAKYYERLVPRWMNECNLVEFSDSLDAARRASPRRPELVSELRWSVHSRLVPVERIRSLSLAEVIAFCDEFLPTLDLWSITGLAESLARRSDIREKAAQDLVARVLRDFQEKLSTKSFRAEMTVGLGFLADSILSTSAQFTQRPVYWRRLASFSHAALLESCILATSGDPREFARWTLQTAPTFQAATLGDLWSEPRWNGFMYSPSQLKQELFGRVLNAFGEVRAELTSEVEALLFGDAEDAFESHRNPYFSSLPGPLEGGEDTAVKLPEFLVEQVLSVLKDESQSLDSRLVAAAHLVAMGTAPETIWNELQKALEAFENEVRVESAEVAWTSLLTRVSLAAALSRNAELSRTVRRVAQGANSDSFPLQVYAGLSACGAFSNEAEWRREVSEFASRIALGAKSRDDVEYLSFVLGAMEDARPLLRPMTARLSTRLKARSQQIGWFDGVSKS